MTHEQAAIPKNELGKAIARQLRDSQLPTGEFKTYARTTEGDNFYIGSSPFATAHIAYLLSDSAYDGTQQIVSQALSFLRQLDESSMGLYKYWYPSSVANTSYPFLAYDMDDTAVANALFALHGQPVIDSFIIDNNVNPQGNYYTWLQPSWRSLAKKPSLLKVYWQYFKVYSLFAKNQSGLNMALYKDSEMMVRMNVAILKAIAQQPSRLGLDAIPVALTEVLEELRTSLHYDNVAMYYLTLAKLQKHSGMLPEPKVTEMAAEIKKAIHTTAPPPPNKIALYLSLAYIGKLSVPDKKDAGGILGQYNDWAETGFDICVGNKRYETYHTYLSSDLTKAIAIALLPFVEEETNAEG